MNEKIILSLAFRNPDGFVFLNNAVLYRQVNQSYKMEYDRLMDSGLYDRLVNANLFIPHQEAKASLARSENAYKILEPRQIPFVSYPYEWCFSQLRDAALAVLKIQKRALERGMILEEASAFSMQFMEGWPMLINPLVFGPYREGEPWPAYGQFCRHFLAPLALASCRDSRLLLLLRTHLDGVPLDLASTILPLTSWFNPGVLFHVHVHARVGDGFFPPEIKKKPEKFPNRETLMNLADKLRSTILSLKIKTNACAAYDPAHAYSPQALEHKKDTVYGFIKRVKPKNLWDIGTHTGDYARMAAGQRIQTIAWDWDHGCVESCYDRAVNADETRLLPLVGDLSNPSPNLGWDYKERDSLTERGPADMVLALDLVHHLTLRHKVPMGRIARFLSGFCHFLVVEYIPFSEKEKQPGEAISALFGRDSFEDVFSRFFRIVERVSIHDSNRTLYLMEPHNK